MAGETYLVCIDILGYKDLPQQISDKCRVDERKVRKDLCDTISERVEIAKSRDWLIGLNYGGKDDWTLATDSFDSALRIVTTILDHNTGYKDYKRVPLEIGIGTAAYDRWAKLSGRDLVCEKATIDLFRENLLTYYHKWHKTTFGKELVPTFIVLTESTYQRIEPLDKRMCQEIKHITKEGQAKKVITFYAANVAKVEKRGKVFEFLERIGCAGSEVYGRIDDLYVPPREYEAIKEALKRDRIVFLTGTPEYGKTYTAVRLLWEYYNDGYEPVLRTGEKEREREEERKRLEEIGRELKPRHIIYFEDPFGKTKYESTELLEKEIGTIVDRVRSTQDVYLIITSREEVFKEFEKQQLSSKSLKQFEQQLNIRKPSYDLRRRKEILFQRAESKDCKWLKVESLRETISRRMEDEGVLPTPLSITDFVNSSVNITKADELKEKINEKSNETAIRFAKEIDGMSRDKILFLSFPLIGDFHVDVIRTEYEQLVKQLRIERAEPFSEVLDWFKGDKVDIRSGSISISHAAYSESLRHILVDKSGRPTWISREVFGRVLLKLAKNSETVGAVAWVIVAHYDVLTEDVRGVLLQLAYKSEAAGYLAWAIVAHFDRLPENVRNELLQRLAYKSEATAAVATAIVVHFDKLPENVRGILLQLADKSETAKCLASALVAHFDRLPENVRNELLQRLAYKSEASDYLTQTIVEHFDGIPENVKELLFKLADKSDAARDLAWAIVMHFDKLPENVRNLLFKLADKSDAAQDLAWAIVMYFDKLPENVRNELLQRLAYKSEAAWYVAWVIEAHFTKLPENVRNELLLKLADQSAATGVIVSIIVAHFDELPESARGILFKLADGSRAAENLASPIMAHFDELPENVRNLLFKLAGKSDAAKHLAEAIAMYFDKLPGDVRNELLLRLADQSEAANDLAWVVQAHFTKLPENVRNELLLKLADQSAVGGSIARIIAQNFKELPENIRSILGKLWPQLHQDLIEFSHSPFKHDRLYAIKMILSTWSKIDKKVAYGIISELSHDKDRQIRGIAKETIDVIRTELKDAN